MALTSLLAAIVLTVAKLGVGLWTGSLGILAEAAHSGLDLVAALMTFWAVRVAGQPPDREHTYGHGKFENLAALMETFLLLMTCAWIFYEGFERLLFDGHVPVHASVWAFGVVVLSIVVDVSRSRALKRVADKYNSQALEADALHFSTDVWSSAVVLLGLVAVAASQRLQLAWLAKADALAAVAVAAIVVVVSIRLGRKAINDLLDAVPPDLLDKVAAAARVPGAVDIKHVRVRRAGAHVFADVTLTVESGAALQRAHGVADRAESAIRDVLPGSDVVVHVEPSSSKNSDMLTRVRAIALQHGLAAHGMRLYDESGEYSLELHLEVPESLALEQAHELASTFERDVRAALPELVSVATRLEPAGDKHATKPSESLGDEPVLRIVREFLQQEPLARDAHRVRVRRVGDELDVSLHCKMDAATGMADVHAFTTRAERYLRDRLPAVARVLIHVDPASDCGTTNGNPG